MLRNAPLKGFSRILVIGAMILLFAAVLFLMSFVQNLLYSDVRINLTEVVTQNRDVINSRLSLEINSLDMVATQLSDRMSREGLEGSSADLVHTFQDYIGANESTSIFVAATDGSAYLADGSTNDVAGRTYFRLASQGIQNISDRLVSRADGEEAFIISVPIYYANQIVGTVQKIYTPEEMYALCTVSLFSDQGSMYIITSEGYILISSQNTEYSQESDNYFFYLYAQGNQTASNKLKADVQSNLSGFMETTINGQKYFSAYTPVETIHDWYLVSSIATSAVSSNANTVIKMFYAILIFVVLVFAVCLLLFFSYKNRQQAALRRIAFVDPVTQGDTYNKFLVDLRAALTMFSETQFYLLALDIDNFKYVNNYYGFDYGDRLLFHINESITGQLKDGEHVARISGDHFIVLLTQSDPIRLDNLLSSMQTEDGLSVYFSAGIYQIGDRSESVNLMVDKASTAARAAKGTFFKKLEYYSEKFDQQMIHSEQTKRAVEQALANGEMIPFFQPKVNVDTGKLVGAEALARWRKADGKLVPPGEFIPVCEKTGLVIALDMAIFEGTLRFLHRNLDAGVPCVPISVNFSRLHLSNKEFLADVAALLEKYSVPPSLIEVELTESVFFDNYEIMNEFVTRLHDMGLLIDMDDFGSGYSSLNMLMDIPIDVLKIDRAFLAETRNAEKQRVILSAITKMAEELRIKVVVEGVETQSNVQLMRDFGCTVAQGYYFAKPMDESAFQKIFQESFI